MTVSKGLFIGIDYIGTDNELQNCRNDAYDMREIIQDKYGIKNCVVLDETLADNQYHPTKANILKWIKWLVSDNCKGDVLWFHYSGHGAYKVDTNGDEKDGYDETICPLDMDKSGMIIDDDINKLLCKPVVESGAILFFHDDCCHSGSGADLEFRLVEKYDNVDKIYQQTTQETVQNEYKIVSCGKYDYFYDPDPDGQYLCHGVWVTVRKLLKIYKYYYHRFPVSHRVVYYQRKVQVPVTQVITQERSIADWTVSDDTLCPKLEGDGIVYKWSGCMDNQTSADGFNGMANGAMTGCVKTIFKEGTHKTWGEFLRRIRQLLRTNGFSQITQFCTSRKVLPTEKCFSELVEN